RTCRGPPRPEPPRSRRGRESASAQPWCASLVTVAMLDRHREHDGTSCSLGEAGRTSAAAYAALMSMILNVSLPRGAATSTVSPFFLPMIALPTGDSLESLFSAGFASAGPAMVVSTGFFAFPFAKRAFRPAGAPPGLV